MCDDLFHIDTGKKSGLILGLDSIFLSQISPINKHIDIKSTMTTNNHNHDNDE